MHKGYTEAINLLDYTSVVIPVTKADKNVDKKPDDFSALNDKDKKNWDACGCNLEMRCSSD